MDGEIIRKKAEFVMRNFSLSRDYCSFLLAIVEPDGKWRNRESRWLREGEPAPFLWRALHSLCRSILNSIESKGASQHGGVWNEKLVCCPQLGYCLNSPNAPRLKRRHLGDRQCAFFSWQEVLLVLTFCERLITSCRIRGLLSETWLSSRLILSLFR